MMLGLSLSSFAIVHVIISLVAIASGFVVMFGLLGSRRDAGLDHDLPVVLHPH